LCLDAQAIASVNLGQDRDPVDIGPVILVFGHQLDVDEP
jgi:hypothetical protein